VIQRRTYYFFLDTRRPPFTNIKARQAFNYAIDRARIIQLLGLGSAEATPICQILPADFTGHQSYCPYTTGAQNGDWHGPDMGKARRLVKESGTTSVPVTVWIPNDRADEAVGAYLVHLLKELGYKAKLHAASTNWFRFTVPCSTRCGFGKPARGEVLPSGRRSRQRCSWRCRPSVAASGEHPPNNSGVGG
jgi:ABC-type transport system substrate-binding protein